MRRHRGARPAAGGRGESHGGIDQGLHPSDDLAQELQEHVKTVTAPYKYPRIIEFVTELPKTISGKIRRVEIREKDHIE